MFTFDITPDNSDTYRVVATSRDVVRWEKTGRGATLKRLSDDTRMGDLTAVAYFAAVRQGLWSGRLEDFESAVDVKVIDEDDEKKKSGGEGDEEGSDSGPTSPGH